MKTLKCTQISLRNNRYITIQILQISSYFSGSRILHIVDSISQLSQLIKEQDQIKRLIVSSSSLPITSKILEDAILTHSESIIEYRSTGPTYATDYLIST